LDIRPVEFKLGSRLLKLLAAQSLRRLSGFPLRIARIAGEGGGSGSCGDR
jgi:hypothetical protein